MINSSRTSLIMQLRCSRSQWASRRWWQIGGCCRQYVEMWRQLGHWAS